MTPPKIIIFSSMNGRKCFPHMALSGKIYSFFEQNNYLITNNIFEADYVVINTCAFDDFSEQESLEEIDKLYSQFHINQNKLIVVGCLPDISFGEKDWKKDKIIISDRDLLKFDEYFQHNISIHDVEPNFANALKASDAWKTDLIYDDSIDFNKNLFYIEISKWCDQFCSYCSIKKVKGSPKSKKYDDIKAEIKRGVHMWYNEIFLVSDDCGSYGQDIETNIAELLANIHSDFPELKIHINYLEPGAFIKYFPNIHSDILSSIVFINIPMQSLSNRILKLMNRRYNAEEVIQVLKQYRIQNPHCMLANQMIYGFPTETEEEFKKSLEVLDIYHSSSMFCFTPKEGTIAGNLNTLDVKTLLQRTMYLYKIAKNTKYWEYMYLSESKYKTLIEEKYGTL